MKTRKNQSFLNLLVFSLLLLTMLIWSIAKFLVETRFNSGSPLDFYQYSAPFSQQMNFCDLRLPLLGDFVPFSEGWGMQWPLFMILKSAIYSILPFSVESNMIFGLLLTAVGGLVIYYHIGIRTKSILFAFFASCVYFSDRVLWAFTVSGKWGEVLAGLSLLLIFVKADELAKHPASYKALIGFCLPFLIMPLLHPLGMAVVAGLACIHLVFANRFINRCSKLARFAPLICCLLGIVGLCSWFYLQPAALQQLKINLEVQRLIRDTATRFTYFQNYLERFPFASGFLLWIPALAISLLLIVRETTALFTKSDHNSGLGSLLAAASVVAMPVLGYIFRIDNFSYFVIGSTAAIFILASLQEIFGLSNKSYWLFFRNVIFIYSAAAFFAVPAYHIMRYKRSNFPDLRRERREILEPFSKARRIFVPNVLIWEALELAPERAVMASFPVPMLSNIRADYERHVYGNVAPGDILIVNFMAQESNDRFQMKPITQLYPPDSDLWQLIQRRRRTFPGLVEWGWDLGIYKRR